MNRIGTCGAVTFALQPYDVSKGMLLPPVHESIATTRH
jgi:hypothetical protein